MKRREFVKRAGLSCVGFVLTADGFRKVDLCAAPLPASQLLSDPALQPKFVTRVPDALNPGFKYVQRARFGGYGIGVGTGVQQLGLVDTSGGVAGAAVPTPVWGYGDAYDRIYTWPGRTFEIKNLASGGTPTTNVTWFNNLSAVSQHLCPVDTSIHWCYSLMGYDQYTIAANGVPMIPHLHGGHTDYQFDGNPEYFFSPNQAITGPSWNNVMGGFTNKFVYDNNIPAGNLWYHDHALGITRLNVYAGMAGFYFVRDAMDTGLPGNPLGLPAWPYEKAYAIQDRMFLSTGELFYPAMPGDPAYADFITDQGAVLPSDKFPGGGPTSLAEFFGDHIVVNGKIWPYENVYPRLYRMHFLNGCDSRFMALRFRVVNRFATTLAGAGAPLPFNVIGCDQGLAASPTMTDTLLMEPGSRYDVIIDFKGLQGKRVIVENIGGDSPFGGDIGASWPHDFTETDRIMAWDVLTRPNFIDVPFNTAGSYVPDVTVPARTRKVALFEGVDEFGRILPLQGIAEPATDHMGMPINWPDTPDYIDAGLVGQVDGSLAWNNPITENPDLGTTENWEIWNSTMDAHPVHLHLVHFDFIERRQLIWDSATNMDHLLLDMMDMEVEPNGDGAYLVPQPVVKHMGILGSGYRFARTDLGFGPVIPTDPTLYIGNAPRDMVVALPDQITIIKATFDKPGDYVWHCHILSHEDNEMMRGLYVGPMPGSMPMKRVAVGAGPGEFSLDQNYPNPFNPSTTINFKLPISEHVELKVFNTLGQEVRTLVNSRFEAGTHNVVWDGKSNGGLSVATGMYIYRIKAGNFTTSKKMSLMR